MRFYKIEIIYENTNEDNERDTTTFETLSKEEATAFFDKLHDAMNEGKKVVKLIIPGKDYGEDYDSRTYSAHLVKVEGILEVNVEAEEE